MERNRHSCKSSSEKCLSGVRIFGTNRKGFSEEEEWRKKLFVESRSKLAFKKWWVVLEAVTVLWYGKHGAGHRDMQKDRGDYSRVFENTAADMQIPSTPCQPYLRSLAAACTIRLARTPNHCVKVARDAVGTSAKR